MTKITWTNCAEQMPPDESVVIVDHNGKFNIHRGVELWAQVVVYGDPHNYKYTEFTPEKWKELNK